jgi:hypothetical protein
MTLVPNVKAGPPHAAEPPASAAARQHAVGPSRLLGDLVWQYSEFLSLAPFPT